MSEKKWAEEPWHCTPQVSIDLMSGGIRKKEWPIYKTNGRFACPAHASSQADADRIVDCVNALAGISNPKSFVEAAKDIVEYIKEAGYDDGDQMLESLIKAFDAAKKGDGKGE